MHSEKSFKASKTSSSMSECIGGHALQHYNNFDVGDGMSRGCQESVGVTSAV